MKKTYFFLLILSFTFGYSQSRTDTIHLNEATIEPFKKDKNFIENNGKVYNINVLSNALVLTAVVPKKGFSVRAVEFFFDYLESEICDDVSLQFLLFEEVENKKLKKIDFTNETYYILNSERIDKKIFNIENQNIRFEKNKEYFIGLFIEPNKNCNNFTFQGINKKRRSSKTIINPNINDFSNALIQEGFEIKYRIYYK